jgi:hypothetical protein
MVPANPGQWNLMASTNLVDWTVIATVPPASEPVMVVDEGATNIPARFYRLELD